MNERLGFFNIALGLSQGTDVGRQLSSIEAQLSRIRRAGSVLSDITGLGRVTAAQRRAEQSASRAAGLSGDFNAALRQRRSQWEEGDATFRWWISHAKTPEDRAKFRDAFARHREGVQKQLSRQLPIQERLQGLATSSAERVDVLSGLKATATRAFAGGAALAGIAALAAAMAKAVNTMTRYAMALNTTDGSMDRMIRTYHRARSISADNNLTIQEGVTVASEYNKMLRQSSSGMKAFGRDVASVSRVYGSSIQATAQAMRQAIQYGSIRGLNGITGASWGRIQALNLAAGRQADLSTAQGREEAIRTARQQEQGGADEMFAQDPITGLKRAGKSVGGFFARMGTSAWRGATKGFDIAFDAMLGVDPIVRDRQKKQQSDARQSGTAVNDLKEQAALLTSVRQTQMQYKEQWLQTRDAIISASNAVEDMRAAVAQSSLLRNPYMAAQQQMLRGSQGDQFMRHGQDYDPGRAAQMYQGALSGAQGMASRLVQISERMTGRNFMGLYTGSRATGRERYLLAQEAEHMRKSLLDKLNTQQGPLTKEEETLRRGLANGGDTETTLKALREYQESLADKAAKAQEAVIARQEAAAKQFEEMYAAASKHIDVATKAIEEEMRKLRSLPVEVRAQVTMDEEFKTATASILSTISEIGLETGKALEGPRTVLVDTLREMRKVEEHIAAGKPLVPELTPDQKTELRGKSGGGRDGVLIGGVYRSPVATIRGSDQPFIRGRDAEQTDLLRRMAEYAAKTADNTSTAIPDGVQGLN